MTQEHVEGKGSGSAGTSKAELEKAWDDWCARSGNRSKQGCYSKARKIVAEAYLTDEERREGIALAEALQPAEQEQEQEQAPEGKPAGTTIKKQLLANRRGALAQWMEAQKEPPPDKPCWVLLSLGASKPAEGGSGQKLILREYFRAPGGTWRKTSTPPVMGITLDQGMRVADWVGKLPKMGRKRLALNPQNLLRCLPFFVDGTPDRKIARQTEIGRGTVAKLRRYWEEHGREGCYEAE
jgi:hypothetical protein